MLANRRTFLRTTGLAAAFGLCAAPLRALGEAAKVQLGQLVYSGGDWRPRPTALRRLAWEVHKRTAVAMALEPIEIKPTLAALAESPLVYMSGDRPFSAWPEDAVLAATRFIKLGGTLVVDPAYTPEGDGAGFDRSVDDLMGRVLPGIEPFDFPADHVLFRSFYQIGRPVGRVEGPSSLSGWMSDGRAAVIRTRHDLGGALARDNFGNWEHEVNPGGERQREEAIRLGVNIVLYTLCLDYKDEEPHRRFGRDVVEE